MEKWRYHSLIMRDLSIADAKLNAEGEKGWELVTVCIVDPTTARAYFKMPIEDESEEDNGMDRGMMSSNPFPGGIG